MIGFRPIHVKTAAKVLLIFDICKNFTDYFDKKSLFLYFLGCFC